MPSTGTFMKAKKANSGFLRTVRSKCKFPVIFRGILDMLNESNALIALNLAIHFEFLLVT